jgi:uncharacterized coiled-coil DUF342 family protein
MSESIEDMINTKEEFQTKANELKEKRNQLHLKSKNLADERDSLNSSIRDIRNKISEHKKNRDELNERVKHTKEQRNTLNKSYSEIKKRIEELERIRSQSLGTNLNELRKQLRNLETEQMTQPMSPQKEKKLIETISGIHSKIKEQEDFLNKDPKLKKAIEEEKIIKQKAEKQHETVEKLAQRAQEEHEQMIDLIKQLDNMKQILFIKSLLKVLTKFMIWKDRFHQPMRRNAGLEKQRK